ncbi:MAG: hypothetical protein GY741_10825 [Phycisphaeraceae bacterium]|nr:hypothetical protein [Phycisphaeraceae bacterium]
MAISALGSLVLFGAGVDLIAIGNSIGSAVVLFLGLLSTHLAVEFAVVFDFVVDTGPRFRAGKAVA